MRARKLFSFLLAVFVLFSTFPGGMVFAAGVVDGSHAMASCHEAMTPDADSLAGSHHDAPADAPQAQHGCCVGFVGILSPAAFFPVLPGARETVLFLPSLRLASRITGIYRPPRLNA